VQDPRHEPLTPPFERLGPGLTNGSWTTFGPIPGSPSIDKALKIEPWARRDVLSTLCPLNVRSCVAGACTYLQQIPFWLPLPLVPCRFTRPGLDKRDAVFVCEGFSCAWDAGLGFLRKRCAGAGSVCSKWVVAPAASAKRYRIAVSHLLIAPGHTKLSLGKRGALVFSRINQSRTSIG
jgi:hypothetical protein